MKVAVVGAGICGLSAARFLASRGHQVSLFEQFELFHSRGSSHGNSRIVRRAYPDAFYTACMSEAYPLWADLERESGVKLVDECGLLYFGPSDAPDIVAVIDSLGQVGVPHEVLDADAVARVFPALRLDTGEVGIFTPEAGWVHAAKALRASLSVARRHGLIVREHSRSDPFELMRSHNAVVVCAGPWIRDWVEIPVEVTLQTFAYLQARIEGPVWIEDGPNLLYGFPSDADGLKIGVHRHGPTIDADIPDRQPQTADLETIRDFGRRRFGSDFELKHASSCLYTSTHDEDFILGESAPGLFFASACSGHGFKLAPWIGRLLADFVEGKDKPSNHPRFCHPRPPSA